MSFSNLNGPSSLLRVCVDRAEGGLISGTVYSQRLTRPMAFSDMGTLLLRLDRVLERQNSPQAFQQPRTFRADVRPVPAAADPGDGIPLAEIALAQGARATFSLCVLSRRGVSWQGWVDWMDGAPRQQFASALGFVRLVQARLL